MSSPEFTIAQRFVIPFGKYKDTAIDKIAESDEGLLYLDWLNGQDFVRQPLKSHLRSYLSDPTIMKELESANAKRRSSR